MLVKIPLIDMKNGQSGKIVELLGGYGLIRRLQTMGIRPGVSIIKISTSFARGPIVIQIGNNQTALGRGISYKILVEVEE